MPILKNHSDQPIKTLTGYTIPPGGTLPVAQDSLALMSKEPYVQACLRRETLTVEADPVAADDGTEITRATVARATRAELLELILPHYDDNVTAEDFAGVTVEDKDGADGLRTIAARILFADL